MPLPHFYVYLTLNPSLSHYSATAALGQYRGEVSIRKKWTDDTIAGRRLNSSGATPVGGRRSAYSVETLVCSVFVCGAEGLRRRQWGLPAGFLHTGDEAGRGHLTELDAGDAELTDVAFGTAGDGAAVVLADV